MSHPGRVYRLPVDSHWPNPLIALAVTLLDHEVGFAVVGTADAQAVAVEVFAATRARPAELREADYILVLGADSHGAIETAKRGVPAYPDQSATLIYLIPADGSPPTPPRTITLQGPGIRDQAMPQMPGLASAELARINAMNTERPLGVDCIFLNDRNQVMCIPRSTHIRIG